MLHILKFTLGHFNFPEFRSSFDFNLLNFTRIGQVTYFCVYYTPEKSKNVGNDMEKIFDMPTLLQF